ncbi:LppP/LprE family lipoprotein [Corynebacterium variabile]|uniref:LppP/LprE family lipoprotein n=1 Tax=Corynebacterium variabile TaxID=1727 RepID=UPI0028A77A76|nr:LppP/LprE family lipoprotein [Corynebacterium variabile]
MSTTRTRHTLSSLSSLSSLSAVLAAGVLVLGACSSDDTAASDSPSGTVTVTAGPPDSTVAPDPGGEGDGGESDDCSGLTGADAVARWAGDVPPNSGGYPWAPESAETDGYDPCADLSWIILPIKGGTASSPYQIMLFHNGSYLGTATSDAYGFYPDISRVDDATVSVTWHWPKDGESNAGRSGESTAQFTWDESTQSVQMSGEVPPV